MRGHRFFAVKTMLFGAAAGALGMVGCKPLPPSKPASEWTPEEAITKVKAMPSGAPPTDERLTAVIARGRGEMPATRLDDAEMQDLLAYLHSL
jgi:mono/diheme cytochrome c family protein